jgi:hypothetical protein
MRGRILGGTLLLALLIALLGAGWLAYARFLHTYPITRSMHPGEQWTYTITQTIHLSDQHATLSYQVIDTVKQVEPDGSALVERVLKADDTTLNILQRSVAPLGAVATKSVWRCTPNGIETPIQPPNASLFLSTASRDVYPAQPVRQGQEWSTESTTGSLKTRMTHRFEGVHEQDGVPCYKIDSRIESLPGSLPQADGRLTTYIDRERGWIRRIEGQMEFRAGNFNPKIEFRAVGVPTTARAKPASSGSVAKP